LGIAQSLGAKGKKMPRSRKKEHGRGDWRKRGKKRKTKGERKLGGHIHAFEKRKSTRMGKG